MVPIRVKHLKKFFGKVRAVDKISFDVKKGEIMGFLGPNGAGKTTTIRCMMDFLRPDSGSIKILGKDVQKYSDILKEDIGFLSGEMHLYENWTGQEHIDLVRAIRKEKTFESDLIDRLEYDPTKKIKNLSTGNKQKLGLILALMHKPKILILDEPTTGLDPLLQDVIYDTLQEYAKEGSSIFMSSHNLAEVERMCNRALIIKKGKIQSVAKISELRSMKLYSVHVYFEQRVQREEIETNGIHVAKDFGDGYLLNVKGDIGPLLKMVNKYKVKDIEIKHSTLEDVFLEFYKTDSEGNYKTDSTDE